jgi:pimeloyl-ACP methyl ester carboxylesterase
MLHGTAAAKEVFIRQFESDLVDQYRLIAIDLPGHGQSENATNVGSGYSLHGLSDAVFDALNVLGVHDMAILGWSLGGHIAIEMLRSRPLALSGMMLTGTPPAGAGLLSMLRAFQLRPEMLFSSKVKFSTEEAGRFAALCYGTEGSPELVGAIQASDGRSRPVIYRSLIASRPSQRQIVEQASLPIALVNGEGEPIVRLNYLEGLKLRSPVFERPQVIKNAGHAPFLQRPDQFNGLLHRFMTSLREPQVTRRELAPAARVA